MSEIFTTIGSVLIIALPFTLSALLWKLLPSKGAMGEKRVANLLKKLPEDRHKVINNLLIQNNGYILYLSQMYLI